MEEYMKKLFFGLIFLTSINTTEALSDQSEFWTNRSDSGVNGQREVVSSDGGSTMETSSGIFRADSRTRTEAQRALDEVLATIEETEARAQRALEEFFAEAEEIEKRYEREQRATDEFLVGIGELSPQSDVALEAPANIRRRTGETTEILVERHSRDKVTYTCPKGHTFEMEPSRITWVLKSKSPTSANVECFCPECNKQNTWRKIRKYDLDGNFIAEYDSIITAARAFADQNGEEVANVYRRLTFAIAPNGTSQYGDFIWRRPDGEIARHRGLVRRERPDIYREMKAGKNKNVNIKRITMGARKEVYFKCSTCGHRYKMPVAQRTNQGGGCPDCALGLRGRAVSTKGSFFSSIKKAAADKGINENTIFRHSDGRPLSDGTVVTVHPNLNNMPVIEIKEDGAVVHHPSIKEAAKQSRVSIPEIHRSMNDVTHEAIDRRGSFWIADSCPLVEIRSDGKILSHPSIGQAALHCKVGIKEIYSSVRSETHRIKDRQGSIWIADNCPVYKMIVDGKEEDKGKTRKYPSMREAAGELRIDISEIYNSIYDGAEDSKGNMWLTDETFEALGYHFVSKK